MFYDSFYDLVTKQGVAIIFNGINKCCFPLHICDINQVFRDLKFKS